MRAGNRDSGRLCSCGAAHNLCVSRRWVLHVDLDQFLAAAEILRHPELAGLPVVVGGDGDPTKRGVVSTASYEAREFGVGSGVPLRTALKRCPEAIFLPVDANYYESLSTVVMDSLRSFDVPVEVLGWDEAFIAFETDDPLTKAQQIRERVLENSQLSCSVGIGENKLQAKLATGFGKPAGIYTITSGTWFELLGDEPPSALWGIGSRIAKRLETLGILTVNELAAADHSTLAKEFGPNIGPWLSYLGQGLGSTNIRDAPWVARSRSKEVTYQENITEWSQVEREVARIARLAAAADDDGVIREVWRVNVKIRFAPFFTHLKGRKLKEPTTDSDVIADRALDLLAAFEDRRPVRLIGVRVEFTMPE